MTYSNSIARFCIAALLPLAVQAQATQTAPTASAAPSFAIPVPATVARHISINGRRIDYRETAEEVPVKDSVGTMIATLFSTSYVAQTPNASQRPVMFLFNGGPGSSSEDGVHNSFGPRIVVGAPPERGGDSVAIVVDNPNSPIDVTDLVFIDPVGTGYSRLLIPDRKGDVWGTVSDARITADFIDGWLRRHGRLASPVIIAGESYGGLRMTLASKMLADATPREVKLRGLLMISPSTSRERGVHADSNARWVNAIPSFAAVAHFHGRGAFTALPVDQVAAKAEQFAETEYRRALGAGDTLSPAHRDSVVRELVQFTGLPEKLIVDKKLRLTSNDFVMNLLADVGERTGLLNARTHALLSITKTRTPPYNDPSTTPYTLKYNPDSAWKSFFDSLGYKPVPGEQYVRFAMAVNRAWNHKVPADFNDSGAMLRDVVSHYPSLRIMLTVGYYDLTIPYENPVKALRAAALPPGVLDVKVYPTGHAVHSDVSERPLTLGDVRRFVNEVARR